jgi:hypothetical protein
VPIALFMPVEVACMAMAVSTPSAANQSRGFTRGWQDIGDELGPRS